MCKYICRGLKCELDKQIFITLISSSHFYLQLIDNKIERSSCGVFNSLEMRKFLNKLITAKNNNRPEIFTQTYKQDSLEISFRKLSYATEILIEMEDIKVSFKDLHYKASATDLEYTLEYIKDCLRS